MFPGVGSGFTLKMENGEVLNLMALYTSTRHDREEARQQGQQLKVNRMLQVQKDLEAAEDSPPKYELRPAIRELAHTLDALIFVVDASANVNTCESSYLAV